MDGRGAGPAGNTGRGWSWLRSGGEHWTGTTGRRGGGRRREEKEKEATNIKTNNPHLAGGEKQKCIAHPDFII